jgi:transcriptional regulator with XRE-family HTH domain
LSNDVNTLLADFLKNALLLSGFGVIWVQGGDNMTGLGNKSILAKNLSYYVDRSGRTQKELAEMVGVATSTFNDWMKGKKYPRIDKIEMLANYFGILKSDLIEDKENSSNERQLTEGERQMLDLFKLVPEEQQPLVLEMIRAALKTR